MTRTTSASCYVGVTLREVMMTLTRDVVGVTLRDVVTSYNVTLRGAELHIQNVNRSDQLNYICTIANSLGHSNATIFVRVKGTRKPTMTI